MALTCYIMMIVAGIILVIIGFTETTYSTHDPMTMGSFFFLFGSIALISFFIVGPGLSFFIGLALCAPAYFAISKFLDYLTGRYLLFEEDVRKITGAEGVMTESRRFPRSGKVTLNSHTIRGKSEIRVWCSRQDTVPVGERVVVTNPSFFKRILVEPVSYSDTSETT